MSLSWNFLPIPEKILRKYREYMFLPFEKSFQKVILADIIWIFEVFKPGWKSKFELAWWKWHHPQYVPWDAGSQVTRGGSNEGSAREQGRCTCNVSEDSNLKAKNVRCRTWSQLSPACLLRYCSQKPCTYIDTHTYCFRGGFAVYSMYMFVQPIYIYIYLFIHGRLNRRAYLGKGLHHIHVCWKPIQKHIIYIYIYIWFLISCFVLAKKKLNKTHCTYTLHKTWASQTLHRFKRTKPAQPQESQFFLVLCQGLAWKFQKNRGILRALGPVQVSTLYPLGFLGILMCMKSIHFQKSLTAHVQDSQG